MSTSQKFGQGIIRHPLLVPEDPNKTWSMDFVSDRLEGGRTFRVLNIIENGMKPN